MYKIEENFMSFDENLIPYTLKPERHTTIEDLHAATDDRGFILKSIGNRWILKSPKTSDFLFETTFAYNFIKEFDICVHILFGYDERKREGQGVRFMYHLNGSVTVCYIKISRMQVSVIKESCIQNIKINEEENIHLSMSVKNGVLNGVIFGKTFEFEVDSTPGYIVFERKNFIGEWIIKKLSLTINDESEHQCIVPRKCVDIPLREGGDIPYKFSYAIDRIDDKYYLAAELGGGTATRTVNPQDRPGQYATEMDMLVSPFVIVRNGLKEKKFFLFKGEKGICDPNIFWECLKEYFGHPELPIKMTYQIPSNIISDKMTISYGYESLSCKGYFAQAGGPSEFIHDVHGNLIYSGDALGESVYELYSPKDKYAISLIPKDAYKREDIIRHLEVNHYFHIDEDINFTMSIKTQLDVDNFTVSAAIRDVYDTEDVRTLECECSFNNWMTGYKEMTVDVKTVSLPMGVYRVAFTIFYGDSLYNRYIKTFEVFDKNSKISPATASGLPYIFSMPNELKWLMSNTFDLWNPKPSCDDIHYISCVTNTPIEAEKQRIWELVKIFGREWFTWLNRRTCLDWKVESHPDVVKNADYINIPIDYEVFPLRHDLCIVRTYQNPAFREILHDFLKENPEIAKKIKYIPQTGESNFVEQKGMDMPGDHLGYTEFTYEYLKDLLEVCHDEWFEYANMRFLELFRRQNEKMKALNPNFKRSAYGPFNQYTTATSSYHSIKCYGNLPYETLSNDVYTGFCLFEDYPASCAYQTYRGAFAAMTILLHCPNLVMYPEQYKDGFGGCIDGAVKFSHAPMGKYSMPLYFNTTHAFEYVYNTPRKTGDSFSYWNTYGFHRGDHKPDMADLLVRDWKIVLDTKPVRPLKTMAMVTEYVNAEDVFDGDIISLHGHTAMYNRSEEGHGYIYECAREAGVNAPFALKFDTLKTLGKEDCDVLVLPTLKYADADLISEIRRLYEAGISLIAVSDVCGLEDIFGVKESERKIYIDSLVREDEEELIYPNEALFKYDALDAEIIMSAGAGSPVIFKKDRALLINASVSTIGHECFEGAEGKVRRNISRLLKKVLTKEILNISSPLAYGENTGVTLFESERGNTQLLCIDYSPYDNRNIIQNRAKVYFDMPISEIHSTRDFVSVRDKNGYIKEISFDIKQHEAVMFTLDICQQII